MMKRYRYLRGRASWVFVLLVISMGAGFHSVSAGEPCLTMASNSEYTGLKGASNRCGCPDNYFRKTIPCVLPASPCCPDAYCMKPRICIPGPTTPLCPDAYCSKALPVICAPAASSWYKCISPSFVNCRPVASTGKADSHLRSK